MTHQSKKFNTWALRGDTDADWYKSYAIGGARHPVSVRLTTLLGEVHLHSAGFLAQHWREADRLAEAKEVANVDHRNH